MRKLIDPMEWNAEIKQSLIEPMEWFDDVAQASMVPEVNVGNLGDTSIIPVEQTATSKRPLTEPMVWNTPTKQAGSSSATATLTTAPSSSPVSSPKIADAIVICDPQDKVKPYDLAQDFVRHEAIWNINNVVYRYDGCIYRVMTREDMKMLIVQHYRKDVQKTGNSGIVDNIYKLIMIEPRISRKRVSLDRDIIVFQDGVLRLDTWRFLPYHTSKFFATSCLNVCYQKGIRSECPEFSAFIRSIAGMDSDLETRMWQALGYLLTQDQRGKCFFLLQGPHDSGKSVFGNFLRSCMDAEFVSGLDIHSFHRNFALSDLLGKRLCMDMDLSAGALNNRVVSNLKKLTGGDLISADVKYGPRATFVNETQFLFASNHAVFARDVDPAFMRRMVLIPFSRSIPPEEQDKDLLKRFDQERDAIVYKALLYYRSLRDNNYQFAGNYTEQSILTDSDELRDRVYKFAREGCEQSEGCWTPTEELFQAFMRLNGIRCEMNQFSRLLNDSFRLLYSGIKKERRRVSSSSNPTYGYSGIALKYPNEGGVYHAEQWQAV